MCSPFSGFERSTFCWRESSTVLHFLDEGLAIVLVFIGGKMIGERWVHIPVTVSLGVVGGVLLIALLASLLIPPRKQT